MLRRLFRSRSTTAFDRRAPNDAWLAALGATPPDPRALEALRRLLVDGLTAALRSRDPAGGRAAVAWVEDFVQEAMLKILDQLDTFRGDSRFTTWAQKVAVRVAISELRRKRWRDVGLDDLSPADAPPPLPDPGAENPETAAAQQHLVGVVMETIEQELTARQRAALTAVLVQGMPLEIVAERMDTNRNAMYKLLHDARKRLARGLEARGLSAEQILAEL